MSVTIPTYRLFDAIAYQLEKFPKSDMLNMKINGQWKSFSTEETVQIANQFSAGLLKLGIGPGNYTAESADKVALISTNRPEWVFTDIAVQQTGAIITPIYPTTNPLELEYILTEAEVKYVFAGDKALYDKAMSLMGRVPTLQKVYCFDKEEGIPYYQEVLDMADEASLAAVEARKKEIPNSHTATIIYTSGTTGKPKGVMLSHSNIVSNVFMNKAAFPFEDEPKWKVLSFLPLNHIFEKVITYVYFFSGISIFYAESLETIGDNLREVKPHGFTTVPRLLEKVFEKIMAKGNELQGTKRKLFFWAVNLAEQYDNNKSGGFWYDMQLAIANKLIFSKWREALGGNVEYIVTGAAACQPKLLRIFNAAKIPVYEGYGPTENSPAISVNRKAKGRSKFGSVGLPIEGQEVKLLEDGEIVVKGPCVMQGYYLNPVATAETVMDGWLHTGDIGVFDEEGFLKIIDRKKELFKTSGGKYVAPQPIENKLKESHFVAQLIVVGSEQKFVGALIVPSFPTLMEWMREKGINYTTNEAAINHPKVLELYRELIESFNKFFNHVEQIKKFELLPQEWSIESGEMTPTLKLKRKVIMEKYKSAVDRIYS
jgi:long-chain acyl-CoA synthetase